MLSLPDNYCIAKSQLKNIISSNVDGLVVSGGRLREKLLSRSAGKLSDDIFN